MGWIKALQGRHSRVLAEPPSQNPIVVEPFTSQDCSSRPPANANLASIGDRPDVLALSFCVTYRAFAHRPDIGGGFRRGITAD